MNHAEEMIVKTELCWIKTAEPFRTLFPASQSTIDAIAADMRVNGFDYAYPIIMWQGKGVIIDGHTRYQSAKLAELGYVPVIWKDFDGESEALAYAIHCQRNRRNLTPAELFRCLEELDKRRTHGGDRKSEEIKAQNCALNGKSAEETAKLLGVSARKVEQMRTIEDRADEETKEAVKSGEISVNAAYQRTVEAPQLSTVDSSDPIQESIDEVANAVERMAKKIKARFQPEQIRQLIAMLQEAQ